MATIYTFTTELTKTLIFDPTSDILSFDTTFSAANIKLIQVGQDLKVQYADQVDQYVLLSGLTIADLTGTELSFDNGSLLILGSNSNESFTGELGDDLILGEGGNDTLSGGLGNDVLEGGTGNDTLDGGLGNNTYIISKGDGSDTIQFDKSADHVDTVQFTNVSSDEVTELNRVGNDLKIIYNSVDPISNTPIFDTLTLLGYFSGTATQVPQIQFNNGVIWGHNEVLAQNIIMVFNGAIALDTITGNDNFNNKIFGLEGDDVLIGANLNDTIDGGIGNDTLFGRTGNDKLIGGDGNDDLNGEEGNDTLTGGLGNDSLDGGTGSDTFIISKGDGSDTINEFDSSVGHIDTIHFTDVSSLDITSHNRVQNDLIISYNSTDPINFNAKIETLTLAGYFNGVDYQIQKIEFTDTTWTTAYINALINVPPTFTSFPNTTNNIGQSIAIATEDTVVEITFESLLSQSNASDTDGSIIAFDIKNISSGTLRIGATIESANDWNAINNFTIDASHHAYWQADANANDILNNNTPIDAFTAVAIDNMSAESFTPVQITVSVTPVNDAPTLIDPNVTINPLNNGIEDTNYIINTSDLVAGYTDVDNDILSVDNLASDQGSFTNNNGAWTFTPNPNYSGTVDFTYNVIDGNGGSVAANQNFILVAVNDFPVLTDPTLIASLTDGIEDTDYIINTSDLVAGYTDVDNDILSVDNLASDQGSFTNNNGTWTFKPNANYFGTVDFTYNVIDGNGGSVAANQNFILVSVNDEPTFNAFIINNAHGDQSIATVEEDTTVVITLDSLLSQSDAKDIDGSITAFNIKEITSGTLLIGETLETATTWVAGSNFTIDATLHAYWKADANANDALNNNTPLDAFTVVAVDNMGTESITPVQVTVSVTPVNDAPSLTDPTLIASLTDGIEDTDYIINTSDLVAGYTDVDNDILSVDNLASDQGSFTNNNGAWTFTPNANYFGTVDFTYNVIDGNGGSVAANQNFILVSVNDEPTFNAFIINNAHGDQSIATVEEDTTVVITLDSLLSQSDAKDIDGSITAFNIKEITSGTLLIGETLETATTWVAGSNFTIDATLHAYWKADANANDALNNNTPLDAFTVVAVDNNIMGAESITPVQATISVTPVNDAPIGIDTNATIISIDGTPTQYETLTANTSNLSDPDSPNGITNFTYQWYANGTEIIRDINDTSSLDSLTLTQDQVGKEITVKVTYTDDQGTTESVVSSATPPVSDVNEPPTFIVPDPTQPDLPGTITYDDTAFDDSITLIPKTGTLHAIDPEGSAITYNITDADGIVLTSDNIYTVSNSNNKTIVSFNFGVLELNKTTGTYTFKPEVSAIEPLSDDTTINFYVTASDGQLSSNPALLNINIYQKYIDNNTTTESNESDTLIGSSGPDKMNGLDGDDSIDGGDGDDTLIGGNGDDSIEGSDGNDTLIGGDGNDTLTGGLGIDSLIGGNGDDTYYVDDTADKIIEDSTGGSGNDTIISSIDYTLKNNFENLTLFDPEIEGAELAIKGTGNESDNIIIGNIADNILIGGAGNDTLQGGDGNDTLNGGSGSDAMDGGAGNDIYYIDNSNDTITDDLDGIDTVFSSIEYSLNDAVAIENLILTGTAKINGTGNASDNLLIGNPANNVLTGGDGNDTLDGSTGNDTLIGGSGDNTYILDNKQDVFIEEDENGDFGGIDTLVIPFTYKLKSADIEVIENLTLSGITAINATGNANDNVLKGNSAANTLTGADGNDTLDGGAGADKLIGGIGDDVYYVDNAKDTITEVKYSDDYSSFDTVYSSASYVLGTNIEDLYLYTDSENISANNINGTGNKLDNTITGNNGNNILDGGIGLDTLKGGLGDDTYIIDNIDDSIEEDSDSGIDLIKTSIDEYTLPDNFENLTLTGKAITGSGNSENNYITGNANNNILDSGEGDDTIDGGKGADEMTGGTGDDIYFVDNKKDHVNEESSAGNDTVKSYINFALTDTDNIENLTLIGKAAINGTGNNLNNILIGNTAVNSLTGGDGNDTINGGGGNDTLTGGRGDDTFTLSSLSKVTITDFKVGEDKIQLDHLTFKKLSIGNLNTENFITGTKAIDINDYISYNDSTGALFYDADGSAKVKAVQIAVIGTHLVLHNTDFSII